MSLLLVSNPASGSSDEDALALVRKHLSNLGEVTDFVATSAQAFARELKAAAEPFETLVIAGGDGSLSHSVNALRERLGELTFGLIPMGTGNDLAGTLKLSDDPGEAAESIASQEVVEIDVGRVSADGFDRLFVNACVGGFSVAVDEAVDEDEKRKLGRFAFWLGGLRAARDIARYRVEMNDQIVEDAVVVGIGNGRTVGGGLELWPDADLRDGLLDACAISAPDITSGVRAAVKVKTASHQGDEGFHAAKGATIVVDAHPVMELNVDGELLGLRTPATFETGGKLRLLASRSL